jgi:ABC-type polysaccharide/polyol phosphate transport system ATPase subunit
MLRLLDDISFELGEGDRLAILGRNGAGKSTLLRVLNRVYQPSDGSLTIDGSCQALLNISLGFSGEATVRENIYLRGIAMGLNAAFLRGQIDEILEFSGLQEKVNHRLRTLSSGQKMRLGFAISTCVQHDIIMMDEWVGTGDAEFMLRAKERMQGRVGGSKIVVLASHSISLLNGICNKGIVLERGRLVHAGDIASSLKAYHVLMEDLREHREPGLRQDGPSARAYGRVAKLITRADDVLVLEGWCVDEEGRFPGRLVLEMQGQHYPAEDVTRLKRPDVMRRFGLLSDDYGFRATFKLPGATQARAAGLVRVLAGPHAGRLGTALQVAPEVLEQLKMDAPG